MGKNISLKQLIENINEEKNQIYNVSTLNLVIHIDNTWNPQTKESKVTLSTSTKGGVELAINADNEDEYNKAVTAVQTKVAILAKEFNKKLSAALSEYIAEK